MFSIARREGRIVEVKDSGDVFLDLQAVTLFARQWRRLRGENRMIAVHIMAAPVDTAAALDNAAAVALVDSFDITNHDNMEANAVQIFPAPPRSAPLRSKPPASSRALQVLFGKARRPPRAKKAAGLRARLPQPVGALAAGQAPVEADEGVEEEEAEEAEEIGSVPEESSRGSSEDEMDDGAVRRQFIDQWLSPGDGLEFARMAKRRGRGANDFEHEGLYMTRLYSTNKWSGIQRLSGYSCHCAAHVDPERCFLLLGTCFFV